MIDKELQADMIRMGKILKRWRLHKEFTQKELADKAMVSQALISSLENGKANPRMSRLFRITAALDLYIRIMDKRQAAASDSRIDYD